GELLVFELEPELLRIERDRASDILHLVSNTMNALDECVSSCVMGLYGRNHAILSSLSVLPESARLSCRSRCRCRNGRARSARSEALRIPSACAFSGSPPSLRRLNHSSSYAQDGLGRS